MFTNATQDTALKTAVDICIVVSAAIDLISANKSTTALDIKEHVCSKHPGLRLTQYDVIAVMSLRKDMFKSVVNNTASSAYVLHEDIIPILNAMNSQKLSVHPTTRTNLIGLLQNSTKVDEIQWVKKSGATRVLQNILMDKVDSLGYICVNSPIDGYKKIDGRKLQYAIVNNVKYIVK